MQFKFVMALKAMLVSLALVFFVLRVAYAAAPHAPAYRSYRNQQRQFRAASRLSNACFAQDDEEFVESGCSVPCDLFRAESIDISAPFTWAYCPTEPLHFTSSAGHAAPADVKDVVVDFRPPELMPSVGVPRKGSGKKKTVARQSMADGRVPVLTIEAVPAPGTPALGQMFPIGATKVTYQGIITANECLDTAAQENGDVVELYGTFRDANLTIGAAPLECQFTVIVHDTQPPVFTFCPGDREFRLRKHETRVTFTFDKPIAIDNSRKKPYVYQTKGGRSGDRLQPGRHQYQFVARDEEGNSATCEFTARVIRYSDDPVVVRQPPKLSETGLLHSTKRIS